MNIQSYRANNDIVRKSWPLIGLSKSHLTLPEMLILDAYVKSLDIYNDQAREVVFSLSELARMLGIVRILPSQINTRLDHLMGVVTLNDPVNPKSFSKISLFDIAQYDADTSIVRLKCGDSARKYFFNIDNAGYLRYSFALAKAFGSRHTYCLYLILAHYYSLYNGTKEYIVKLSDLRTDLHCEQEYYDDYKRFSNKVLRNAQKRIADIAGFVFDFVPVREGRRVAYIKFRFSSPISPVVDVELLQEEDMYSCDPNAVYDDELLRSIIDACRGEFDVTQVRVILNILTRHEVEEGKIFSLVREQYDRFCYVAKSKESKSPIERRFEYFIRMLDSSFEIAQSSISGYGDADAFFRAALRQGMEDDPLDEVDGDTLEETMK